MTHSNDYSEGAHYYHVPEYSYAYTPNRSPVTGRYISGYHNDMPYGDMNSQNRATMNGGYSGHSIKDRMIARLEPMYDEATSEYERQLIKNTINRIHSEN